MCSSFELFGKTICSLLVHSVEKYADAGDSKGIARVVQFGNFIHFLCYFVPTFLALFFGAEILTNLTNAIPANIMAGIKAVGSLLPALGFGLLLSNLSSKKFMPYFFIGFAIAAYVPSFGVMGVAILGIAYAVLYASNSRVAADQ